MIDPESPKHLVPAQTEQTVMADADWADEDDPLLNKQFHPRSKNRWVLPLGVIILLFGGGLGWHWWQTSHANNAPKAPAAGAGKPQGVPVKLATVETVTVQKLQNLSVP
jgi:hypothetical protein